MVESTARVTEVRGKVERIRELLDRENLDGILFTRQFTVSWLTGGMEDLILRGRDPGFIWAMVTRDATMILTQNIEGPRVEAEEDPASIGFTVETFPWWATDEWAGLVAQIVDPSRIGNDGGGPGRDVSQQLLELRLPLVPEERDRLRAISQEGAAGVEGALRDLKPDTTEAALSADVVARLERQRIFPFAVLLGSDDRRRRWRHPTVSDRVIERDVLLVIVGARGGLNTALTRSASFGPCDPDLVRRHAVACEAEAAMIAVTRPGNTYGDAFQAGADVYEEYGYHEEWKHHYQGGPIGYGSREFGVLPPAHPGWTTTFPVAVNHACAWNPTVQGTKSEDTFLVGEDSNELISNTADWPSIEVPVPGGSMTRPAILEL